jgi:hypothetical protein
MIDTDLSCHQDHRRDDVRAASIFGLDYVEVSKDQLTLYVYFLGKAPKKIEKATIRIQGGRRIRDIQVTDVLMRRQADPTLDDFMEVTVDKPGDFSTYTLGVVDLEGFDSRYDDVKFTFKASCPSDLDCKTPHICPPPQRTQPEINYLAKDYTSFRQLILDRLALIMPDWTETHVPDLGITLVELLAYVGDYLSYYQDAVATEAYLGTARQRISVRRHVKLVDYSMHEGCNARAWIAIATDTDLPFDPKEIYFITGYAGVPARRILTPPDLEQVPPSSYEVFEPLWPASGTIEIYKAHSEIPFYTWGDCECCLAKGATSATLIDRSVAGDGDSAKATALKLKAGDVLIFEEVIGPKTGNPADADPTHRQAVRLTKVTAATDPLYHDQPLVEIEWAREDALTFPLCLSVQAPPPKCDCLENVSVARGNVVLVDNGAGVVEQLGTVPTESSAEKCATQCKPAEITTSAGPFRPVLEQRPLTFSQPIASGIPASVLVVQDPRQALPAISLARIPPAPGFAASIPPLFTFDDVADPTGLAKLLKAAADVASRFLLAQLRQTTKQALAAWDGASPLPAPLRAALVADLTALFDSWLPKSDLLEGGPGDRAFVVEMDDDGYGHLRFGDGSLGQLPEAGAAFQATYRYGNGPSGNVGAETILYLVLRQETLSGVTLAPRNPLAATGGAPPEPVPDVKMFAPFAFRDILERAIIADDYATLAANPALQGAKATLRWTGSWYEALVAVDPLGTEQASAKLLHAVTEQLEPFRRVGHDLMVSQAQYVPLDLALTICVLPNYQRAHVELALLGVLGVQGLFAPDNLTFGEGIYVSKIVAAAQAVPGVQNVVVTRLERYEIGEPSPGESATDEVPAGSVLTLGPLEIARLDNDPNFPENGRLTLDMRGGR